MNVQIKYDGTDVTNYVLNYSRQQQICTGIGNANFVLSSTTTITPRTYKEFQLYEEGIKKGTYVVTDFTEDAPGGMISFGCQDYSKRLQDYFIPDTFVVTEPTTAKFLIMKYLDEAAVSYNFTVSDEGNLVNNQSTFGLTDTLSIITQLLQMNGWYMYFNPDNVAQIGRFEFEADTVDMTVDKSSCIQFVTTNNDTMFRNRVVVWGMGDPDNDTWVHAVIDETGNYPNEYDKSDTRTIVVANPYIPDNATAMSLASKAIKEFTKTSYEVAIDIIGPQDIVLGDHLYLDVPKLQFLGVVTSVGSALSPNGNITHVVLNQRCPRLFSYYDYGGYVYIGTQDAGVWRKHIRTDHVWSNYSTGLTNLYVTDLYVANGLLVCTTKDGSLWTRLSSSATWSRVTVKGNLHSGEAITETGLTFVACSINNITSEVYAIANINGGILGGDNCFLLRKKGQVGILQAVNFQGDYIVMGTDVDTDNQNPIITCIVGGKVYVDRTIVRNSERTFEHFENDDLSDLKNGISYYRNYNNRTHPGWSDGRQQQPPNTFYGPYCYQPMAFYEGTYYFGSFINSVYRFNQRNYSDPAKSVTGFGLGIGSVDMSIIDADRIVVTGTTQGVIGHTDTGRRSYLADFNSTVDAIPLPPATYNISVCYALPNGWVVSTGIGGDRSLLGSVYDPDYYGYNLGRILTSETGDVIQTVPQEGFELNGDPKVTRWYGGLGSAVNVDGMTYGVYWTVEAGGTEFYPTNWNYWHTYTFSYGVDVKGGLMISGASQEIDRFALRSWTERIDNVEYVRDNGKDAVIGGPGGLGIDYVKKEAYFTIETKNGGSDIVQIYVLNLQDISSFVRMDHQMGDAVPTGFLNNEKRFYFTVGNKVYRSTNLSTPLCTLPDGAVIADKLDTYTNEGIFTIWKPLPNPDNTAHYEIYVFDPEFGTYYLLDKTITNQYTNFNGTIDPYNRGFDFRGNRLTMGGDSQWTLFPTTVTEWANAAYIPMTLIARSSDVASGVFDYSTAMRKYAKVEISNYSPYVVFDGELAISYFPFNNTNLLSSNSRSLSPSSSPSSTPPTTPPQYTTNSGLMYYSSTAEVGSWTYDLPVDGRVIETRSCKVKDASGFTNTVFYTVDPVETAAVVSGSSSLSKSPSSSKSPSASISPSLSTSISASPSYGPDGDTILYALTRTDVGYNIASYKTFTGKVKMIETTNNLDQPFIFVSVEKNSGTTFYQKDGNDGSSYIGDFVERNTSLPNSPITVIRTDNRI